MEKISTFQDLDLKNPEHRKVLVAVRNEAESVVQVQEMTGIPARTLRDFFNRVTWSEWWDEYDAEDNPEELRILLIDVETAPTAAYVWKRWDNNVFQDQVIQEGKYLLSYAARWLGSDNVMSDNLSNHTDVNSIDPEVRANDKALAVAVWELYDRAHWVIGHNLKKFDTKVANTRFILHGLNPPSSYKQIDTLLVLRANFALASNKLDDACQLFGIGQKRATGGFTLWARCMAGDLEAFKEMENYNIGDIADTLEPLYLKIRPWDRRHPSPAPFYPDAEPMCMSCFSTNLKFEGNHYYTNVSKFRELRCLDCGRASNREKVNQLGIEQRRGFLTGSLT